MNAYISEAAFYFIIFRAVVLIAEVVFLLVKKGRKSDVFPNLICGALVYIAMSLFISAASFSAIMWVSSYSVWTIETQWWMFPIFILMADLSFYIYHWSAHKIPIFWADHSVHHSSQELDFTTNLRNSCFSALYSWWPVIPFLLVGFSPVAILWSRAFVNDYTFFLHTQYIHKLGWFERFFNTPSHHRVHHSSNPEYIDKNFGFLFIFWDKLLGTYAEESAPCKFGMREGPNSRNPVKIMFFQWGNLVSSTWNAKGWRNKARQLTSF